MSQGWGVLGYTGMGSGRWGGSRERLGLLERWVGLGVGSLIDVQ